MIRYEFKYKVQSFIDDCTYPFRRTFNWAIKSFQYSLILWNDYDWDWVYIAKILKYKLERTRKCIKKNNLVLNAETQCRQIRLAELLLKRIIEDNYCLHDYDELEAKWGEMDLNRGCKRSKVLTEQDQEEFRKDLARSRKHEEYLARQDMDYLFKHLSKYLKSWWD